MVVSSEEMMNKAIEMFKELGMDKISIPMICNEFHVTKGSFYHHFKSKEDLLLQWIVKSYRQIESDYLCNYQIMTYEDFKKKELIWAGFVEKLGTELSLPAINTIIQYRKNSKGFTSINISDLNSSDVKIVQNLMDSEQIEQYCSASELVRLYSNLVIGICIEWAISDGLFDINERIKFAFEFVYREKNK